MSKLRRYTAVSLLFTAACGEGPIDPEVTVATVTVSPRTATIPEPGGTVQLSATVRGSDGSTLSLTLSWSSGDPGVATVSSSGLVTGVAEGSVFITASVSGVLGSANVTVNEPAGPCADAQTVTLAPGGSALYDASACLLLPSGQAGHRYRVAVYRPTPVADETDVSTVDLQVIGVGVSQSRSAPAPAAVRSPEPPALPPGSGSDALERSLAMAAATERVHLERRAQGARLWRELGPDALLPSLSGRALSAAALAASPAKMQLFTATPGICSGGETATALLIAENDHLAIYQDSTQNESTPVTPEQAGKILDYYGLYGSQVISDYFGDPPDVDGNGKIVAFVTPSVSGYAALTLERDLFDPQDCPSSNAMELMYVNNELVQWMDDADPSWQALETVVHEARHIVDFYHRIVATRRTGTDQSHPTWIQEGTAEIAGGMSSRVAWAAVGGPAVGFEVGLEDIGELPGSILPENYGVLLRMARTVYYLSSQPNGVVVRPNGGGAGADEYASGWHFHRWLGDAYGNASTPFADGALFTEQNDSLSAGGVAGLEALTGKGFDDLLEEFFTAVMLEGTGAPEPARVFSTYDFFTATDVLTSQPNGAYPWPVTEQSTTRGVTTPASFNTALFSGPIGPSGVRIHDLLSNGTGTGAQIQVSASPPAKILVVRIQ